MELDPEEFEEEIFMELEDLIGVVEDSPSDDSEVPFFDLELFKSYRKEHSLDLHPK